MSEPLVEAGPRGGWDRGGSPPSVEDSADAMTDPNPTARTALVDPNRDWRTGRWLPGNAAATGAGGGAGRMARFRRVVLESVHDDDLRAVVRELVRMAKDGDLVAAALLLDRCCGKPSPPLPPEDNRLGAILAIERQRWLRPPANLPPEERARVQAQLDSEATWARAELERQGDG